MWCFWPLGSPSIRFVHWCIATRSLWSAAQEVRELSDGQLLEDLVELDQSDPAPVSESAMALTVELNNLNKLTKKAKRMERCAGRSL